MCKISSVIADMPFAARFFSPLHGNFQTALAEGKVVHLPADPSAVESKPSRSPLITSTFPSADPLPAKIHREVVKEVPHLNYGAGMAQGHILRPAGLS